ncbi:MAG: shikimate kinase [Thermoplasmata archaeon]|nr:shikimate kinase [Thermoplasmata archaeon]
MIGTAACRGAATIVNAIACGKGAALGITLETDVRLELERAEGGISVEGAPEGDDLVAGCVRAVAAGSGHDMVNGKAIIKSNIPISRGLKSSSAATNAVTLAASRALGAGLTDEGLLDIAINESIKAHVTVTGAFDDATACFHGGIVITDNIKRRILKSGRVKENLEVVIHVPARQIRKSDVDKNEFAAHSEEFEEALRLAIRGEYGAAMDLNSRLSSDILDISNEVAESARKSGAYAAGITGTGPATVVLSRPDRLQEIMERMRVYEGEILRARLNDTCSREVVPRLL